MPTLTVARLQPFTRAVFEAAGASPTNAARVAEALVSANLAGHDSHGVMHIPGYVAELERGAIVGAGEPTVLAETPTTARVSGGWTFGQVGAGHATRLAIAKARERQVALVSLVEAHHIGRLGEYGEMGVAADTIVLIMEGFAQAAANQAPFGGARAVLGTNPMAIGIPAGERPGMVLDFATSAIAAGKLAVARARGLPVPEGVIIDREGRPTTDPLALANGGALLPVGGHKGYALALAIEFMARVLGGGETHARAVGSPFNEAATLIIAINPAAFRPLAAYHAAADDLLARVGAVPPAPGVAEVMAPGEPERRARAARLTGGIPVPESTWRAIGETARRLGVEPPSAG